MYEYVGAGTRAAEGFASDQVLSCLRDNSSGGPPLVALFPARASGSLTPDPAGVGVGRARFVS